MKISFFVEPDILNGFLLGKSNTVNAYYTESGAMARITITEEELNNDFYIEDKGKYITLKRKVKLFNVKDLQEKYNEMPYKKREEYKDKGREIYNEYSDPEFAIQGAERIIESWFYRSLYSKEHGKHPDLENYIAMILNHEKTKKDFEKCYDLLIEKYGKLPGIEEGYSYYK